MLKRIRFTPAQLMGRLKAAGYKPVTLTAAQLASVDTLLKYRYAPVLTNRGPYKKFVKIYINGVAADAPWRHAAYVIMSHAVTEMRRAYKHKGIW